MQSEESQTSSLYPLVLEPIFKYRIWGGRRLGKLLGKTLPPDEPIGESWEASCRGEDNNVIKNGPLAGRTLADVMEADREALLGPSHGADLSFPLLNKFIDAHNLLSVQVHPDERVAAEIAGAEAKTEAWYVMHADPGATLIKGLQPGVTREVFEEAILNDTVPTTLNSVPVSTGDMVFVPAGCVHAMGKGLVVCEVQQNSDTTYRVYDWGRVGADGKPRQLHVEQALEAIDFDDRSPDKVAPVDVVEGKNMRSHLVACPYFAMQRLTLKEPSRESTGKRRFESLMMASGAGVIRAGGCEDTPVAAGDSVLIPACVGEYEIAPEGGLEILRIFVPDVEEEIVQPLLSAGASREAVDAIVFK
jgi:mannose-6-phosphate isomerase